MNMVEGWFTCIRWEKNVALCYILQITWMMQIFFCLLVV